MQRDTWIGYGLIALNSLFAAAMAVSHDTAPGWFLTFEWGVLGVAALSFIYHLTLRPKILRRKLDKLDRDLRAAMHLPDAEWERERDRLMRPWR
jgi:hypothetical protein